MFDRTARRIGPVHAAGHRRRRGVAARSDPMDELVSIYAYRSVAAIEALARRAFARLRLRTRPSPEHAAAHPRWPG